LSTLNAPTISFGIGNIYAGLAKGNYAETTLWFNEIPLYLGLFTRVVSGIPDTRNAWQDNGNAEPEPGEINYFNISRFHQREIGMKIATAYSWNQFYISTAIKPHLQTLAANTRYGLGIDVNTSYQLAKGLTLTGRIENALGLYKWNMGSIEKNKPQGKLGSILTFNTITIGGEVGRDLMQPHGLMYSLGSEICLQSNLFIRGGKSHTAMFTAGVGIRLPYLQLDYAYVQPAEELPFKPAQFFTLSFFTKELQRLKGKITP